jgi:signal peptidase
MKQKIKNTLFLIFVSLMVVYIGINAFVPEKSIRIFGFRPFLVLTTSMEPDINKGDMIIVTKPKEDKLNVGTAITFYAFIPELNTYSYVTHYIGKIETNSDGQTIYKTHGATSIPGVYDDWTDEFGNHHDIIYNDVVGIYLFKIPYVGSLVNMIKDPIFDVLLIANSIIIYYLYRLIKKTPIKQK